MTETAPTHESPKQSVEGLYPDYMEMIRAFVNEGILEVEEPTEAQKDWAQAASLGDADLATTFGYLAQLTERAHKQRYLEGMPMLIDTKDGNNEPFIDFEPTERYHFLRLIVRDQQALADIPSEPDMGDLPKVLYFAPAEYEVFEQELAEVIEQDPHLPAIQPIACLGEACAKFSGVACEAFEEWITADGPTAGRDLSKPPLHEEAVSITYGQACGNDEGGRYLSVRTDVHKPGEVNQMQLVATSDRYGVPSSIRIVPSDTTYNVETIASSDG